MITICFSWWFLLSRVPFFIWGKNQKSNWGKKQSTLTIWSSQFNMVKIWMIIISIKNSDNNLHFLDALLDDWSKFHRHQRFVPSKEILKSYVNFQLSGHTGLFMAILNFFVEVTYFWGFFHGLSGQKRYKMSFCTL